MTKNTTEKKLTQSDIRGVFIRSNLFQGSLKLRSVGGVGVWLFPFWFCGCAGGGIHGNLLFANWLNYYVYQITPYDLRHM
ncbi:hypothetical protein ACTXQV_73155, partial [Klebsiella pneumoniae]